ncbi:hypothetical protein N9922_05175 [Cyclobacteriaceae bacterium]|nr:hypothetical protein [Cyclobacteriaceae bacterium]
MRNKLDGAFISDVLIGYTLNLMGKSKKDVEDYFTNVKLNYNENEDATYFLGQLSSRCNIIISLVNNQVSRIVIVLIGPPLKKDLSNLKLFAKMHEKEYEFFSMKDEDAGHTIAFQAK